MQETIKILQIIPAEGWRAHYRSDEGRVPDYYEQVVCFALVEITDEYGKTEDVLPMSAWEFHVEFCKYNPEFYRVTHENDVPIESPNNGEQPLRARARREVKWLS